jgi:peptide deformylase
LRIRTYPDPVLRRRAEPIETIDRNVREVALKMIELMFQADGIGLAGPQVGLPWRIFVAHVPETDDRSAESDPVTATTEPRVYINPTITDPTGPLEASEEGCLSLPDIRGDILRPSAVTISALDIEGQPFTQTGADLLARCWQHEADHLDGVLIIDKMPQMSRLKNRAAIRALERQSGDLL